ncbi:MAG: histidine phosphatase family protein [Pirellula sp.]|nr:histidine phosphatase family protein [Pirellula sp.]
MLLYVIRHGETTFNAEGRIQGQLDTQLSPLGRAQAEAIARGMAGSDIEAVFASPLSRAYETARPVAAACRLEIRTDDRLKELNAGVFQNLLPAEMAEQYPEATARWKSHDPDYRIPGGESRRDLMVRGAAAFEAIFASGLQTVAVVAHGGLLTAALKALLGIPADRHPFMLYNGSISRLAHDTQVRLLTLNEIDHLRGPDGKLQTRMGDL